jgi:purine-cytosine permease-like protein
MRRLILIEWTIILIALFSLLPVAFGYQQPIWYRIYLIIILLALIWVTRNRVQRTKEAAMEAQKKHDEIVGPGR